MKRIKIFGIIYILFGLSVIFAEAKAVGNEGTELPVPISFKCDVQLMKNAVLIDAIDFELSELNPATSYTISETDSDLVFIFDDVSTSVNMSLIIGNSSKYCVGFRGKSNAIYVQISPDLKYQFELSLGIIGSDDMKQTEIVNRCSGHLEIYQVASQCGL